MALSDSFIVFILILLAYTIWNHINMSRIARASAKQHCDSLGLQFLDQNIIIRGLSLHRSPHSLLAIGRHYSFEFSSVGDQRYLGEVFLVGNRLKTVELAPYKVFVDKNNDIN